MKRILVALGFAITLTCTTASLQANEPGWWGRVVATERERVQVERTPIVYRPYRPFHFYGNTIRRSYYRGNPLPQPRDFVFGVAH